MNWSDLKVLVLDDALGAANIVQDLLESLENVAQAQVVSPLNEDWDFPAADVIILGQRWLHLARSVRLRYPLSFIVGRCPWYDEVESEFHPWGDQLRDPSLPLPRLLPGR